MCACVHHPEPEVAVSCFLRRLLLLSFPEPGSCDCLMKPHMKPHRALRDLRDLLRDLRDLMDLRDQEEAAEPSRRLLTRCDGPQMFHELCVRF